MASIAEPVQVQAPPAARAQPLRDFQIVPLAGLPIVAVVIVGMIVAIATNSLWALDFYHIVGGGLWTGIDLFLGLVLGPIMGSMSIPARVEFSTRLMPKMLLIMPTLEPANIAVLFELRKPQPNGARIERLMKVFIYTAGITGLMQVATLVIMTHIAAG